MAEPRSARHTVHSRDAALRSLRRINRWMIAASVAVTGVLADVAANAFPGKTVKSGTGAKAASARAQHPQAKSPNSSTGVLRPPAQPPQPSTESQSSEAPPSREAAPAQESAPTREAAPAQESAPAQEATAPKESTPAQEPTPSSEAPAVSGGS